MSRLQSGSGLRLGVALSVVSTVLRRSAARLLFWHRAGHGTCVCCRCSGRRRPMGLGTARMGRRLRQCQRQPLQQYQCQPSTDQLITLGCRMPQDGPAISRGRQVGQQDAQAVDKFRFLAVPCGPRPDRWRGGVGGVGRPGGPGGVGGVGGVGRPGGPGGVGGVGGVGRPGGPGAAGGPGGVGAGGIGGVGGAGGGRPGGAGGMAAQAAWPAGRSGGVGGAGGMAGGRTWRRRWRSAVLVTRWRVVLPIGPRNGQPARWRGADRPTSERGAFGT